MTVTAVTMVKDEADIIEPVLRHLTAEGVDRIIVADNMSTDGTFDILHDLQTDLPLILELDDDPAYEQARKMTRLARQAADLGATWVLPFDADEIWYAPTGTIATALNTCDADIVTALGFDHIVTHPTDPPFAPHRRPETQKLPKVAFRAHPHAELHMGNHDVNRPGTRQAGTLAYRHFQYRSLEQMARKLRQGRAAYEASTVHPLHGTHWREGGLLTDTQMAAKWEALTNTPGLIHDPAPLRRKEAVA